MVASNEDTVMDYSWFIRIDGGEMFRHGGQDHVSSLGSGITSGARAWNLRLEKDS